MISEARRIFSFLYSKALSSISMFYKSKLAFCNFIQLEKWSVERGASFMFLYPNQGVRLKVTPRPNAILLDIKIYQIIHTIPCDTIRYYTYHTYHTYIHIYHTCIPCTWYIHIWYTHMIHTYDTYMGWFGHDLSMF